MEEIVVALRETRKTADSMQWVPDGSSARSRHSSGSSDLVDLRDNEIERLLAENARLNARVISLLKVIEQEQTKNAQASVEKAASVEIDRETITREVRSALETELSPLLLFLLRLLERQGNEPAEHESDPGREAAASGSAPSEWIVNLMHKLDGKTELPNDPAAIDDAMRRRSHLRQCVADVLAAIGIEHAANAVRRRPMTTEDPR